MPASRKKKETRARKGKPSESPIIVSD